MDVATLTSGTHQVNETAVVDIGPNRMEAYITFSAPDTGGKAMALEEVVAVLAQAGVKPDATLLSQAMADKRHDRRQIIARGKEATTGTDGYLQFHFDRTNLKPKPKIMEDGSVNFKQLDMFRLCNRGDVLVSVVPAIEGTPGIDVTGEAVVPAKPKPPAPIPRGKGTVLSDDGLHLIADVSGMLLIIDGKINISPQMDIKGNVDMSTGDIEFNGQVTIRGNVVSGFTVKAAGNIEVAGVCEGATLISEKGNIVLGNGCQGSDKAVLHAAGDITTKFLEGCKDVVAGGNIMADSIMNSKVKCDGTVTLAGKKGLLVGGHMVAGAKLVARTIGSPMGTLTDIEVGGSPRELARHKEMVAEYDKLKAEYEKADKAISTLNIMKQRDQLTEDKKALLIKMINLKMAYRDKMLKLQDGIDELARVLVANVGTVAATSMIRPGVRVTIGSAQLVVKEDLSNCKLRNNGEKIAIGPNL